MLKWIPKHKKKILFIYSGGTIGLVPKKEKGNVFLVRSKNKTEFEKAVKPAIKKFSHFLDVSYEFFSSKDSSNMTHLDWKKLILRVKKAQEQGFDAVAIAHGTDTLAYTASALAFGLHGTNPLQSGLRIPVCITGSQRPIYRGGTDGSFNLENLFRVLSVAIDEGVADVMINFWNRVLLGCRALKVSDRNFDAFQSPSFADVGSMNANGISLNKGMLKLKDNASQKIAVAPNFDSMVLSIDLSPGISPDTLLEIIFNKKISAVIFKAFGEGNVCSTGKMSLLPVIKKLAKKGIPVFITSKLIGGTTVSYHYETGIRPINAGAIPCYDHTEVALDIKIRWLIANGLCSSIEDFRKAMKTSYAGEVTDSNK